MKEALLLGDFQAFGEHLRRGWQSKRSIAHNISNSQIDDILVAAIESGALGGKISGAGGGGFMMIAVPPERKPAVLQRLKTFPGEIFNCILTQEGARAWKVR
jgi:D-glycero-alpha-D-manno-heptose-7-phosphate kinase